MSLFTRAPKSLCILRLSAVGDVCHALAVIQHIQAYYPKTQITWVVGKTEFGLLEGIPNITLIPYDKKTGWKGLFSLWKTLKNQHFDALLNMQTAFRVSIISLGIKAKYKIGFGKKRSREGQWLFVNRQVNDPDSPHVLDGFMAFAEYIGVPKAKLTWKLEISPLESEYAYQFIDSSRKNLLISPCSSKVEKDWLIERYAEVANIANKRNIHVIFCSSSSKRELEMVEKIIALCDFKPTNASGKTNLKQLAALISQVDLVLSPDSGPAHIATAQNTPVIGLYAYHNPLRTGPYHNLSNVVSVYEENAQKEFGKPSSLLPWVTKLKGKDLMAQIQVDSVIKEMNKLGL